MNNSVLSCQQLSKHFQVGPERVTVLDQVDFTVAPGESVAIVGSSGSGKSTLLHLLGGLEAPSTGTVFWQATNVYTLEEAARCQRRNRHLGFVYQFHHLLPEFNALENVAMPLWIQGMAPEQARERAVADLAAVGLAHRQLHQVGQLSGGERQRVALARALVTRPACVLADEPTGNLDARTAGQVMEVLLELQRQYGTSFVIVTHDQAIAKRLNRCCYLNAGKLK